MSNERRSTSHWRDANIAQGGDQAGCRADLAHSRRDARRTHQSVGARDRTSGCLDAGRVPRPCRPRDVIEPFARELAEKGRTSRKRKGILQLIGNALLVQQRVAGRVAVAEKPDALWEKPQLDRLYARLEDEYELKERLDTLERKITVIAETADALTDIIDTQRSLRLEIAVVVLIVIEVVIGCVQIFAGIH
jgi:hypothetical protein